MNLDRLTIRPEQLRTLSRSFAEQARIRMEDQCWFAYPEICEALGDAEVSRLVLSGMALARANGYETYSDIATIVDLVIFWGEHFEEEFPWARRIWTSALPPARKLAALTAAASEERIREILEEGDA